MILALILYRTSYPLLTTCLTVSQYFLEKCSLSFFGWGLLGMECAKELSFKDHFFPPTFPRCPSMQPQTNGVKHIMLWKHHWSCWTFTKITLISTIHSQNWVGSNATSSSLFLEHILISSLLVCDLNEYWRRSVSPESNNLYLRDGPRV